MNLNKNYYDVISKQSKSIATCLQTRHDVYRTPAAQAKAMKQGKSNAPLTDDLDSLFYSEIGVHNKTVLNELIEEHMVLDDPTNLAAVITSFQ